MLPELIIPTNLNPSCQFLLTGWIFQARYSDFIVVDGILYKQLYLLYAYIINFPAIKVFSGLLHCKIAIFFRDFRLTERYITLPIA